MRVAVLARAPFTCPVIRIDTNQGISGYGEVRYGASKTYALMLKSRILGLNPCNVEMIFKIIKQFGSHGRQGGGVCAVEMALWDLLGKRSGLSLRQMLGGVHPSVAVGVSVGLQASPVALVQAVEGYLSQGYRRIKIKIKPGWDVDVVRQLRARFPDVPTMVELGYRDFEILARNLMNEPTMATPALAQGSLILRTASALYRIRNTEAAK